MIRKLKRRFIALAMVSLAVLLTVIVAGMNIINYNTVITEADETLETLSVNRGRLPFLMEEEKLYITGDSYDDSDQKGWRYEKWRIGFRSDGPRHMSPDEAEETRFFSVLMNSDGQVVHVYTDRIYAVDEDQAEEYAVDVIASGKENGFKGEYRYAVAEEGSFSRITFLDCGRSLDSFRKFMYASIAMSVAGLLAVFGFIVYYSGRIIKPVAESYDKQKRFITDAGHEIKTPLTIIKANIDLMKMDLNDASESQTDGEIISSLNESLDDINGQVDRLTGLTNDLVYLSRMEEGGSELTMVDVPLSDMVKETAESFNAVAQERGKELEISIEPMLAVRGSTGDMEKLVSILVENAMKYSPEGDKVEVSLKREGKTASLEVRNSVTEPISNEDLAHVFERFYRTDKSRNSAAGGHGIGLSMASAIVSAHGGKIRASNGNGNQFIVTASIPLIQRPAALPEKTEQA